MINRIVKLSIMPEKENEFVKNFNLNKSEISNFNGCISLELHKVLNEPCTYVTVSQWESETHLETYRNSDFFKGVWKFTKTLFSDKPLAFSTLNIR